MSDNHPSHYDDHGRARMVDVGGKPTTARTARAQGQISVSDATIAAIQSGTVPKGNPFETARLAAILAAKKTSDLIPLCHPLRLNAIDVVIDLPNQNNAILVTATVAADDRTGVEMEALTAASVALLTIYDMLKAIDRTMVIGPIRLLEKTGGKSQPPRTL